MSDELERLMREATPGPWEVSERAKDWRPQVVSTERGPICTMHIPEIGDADLNADLIVAAVNALPELLAIKAERDRAQRACEQMGERIAYLENSVREIGAAIINGATDTLWMGDQISDESVVDFICNLTGDDPSLLGTFARAALNQEPGTTEVFQELAKKQEPLGAEFEAAIGDRSTLYET